MDLPFLPQLLEPLRSHIADFVFNKNAETEKEVFATLNTLRKTSQTTKSAVDMFVKKYCKDKKLKEEQGTYNIFKLNVMDQIINSKIEKIELPPPFNTHEGITWASAANYYPNATIVEKNITAIEIKKIVVAARMRALKWFENTNKKLGTDLGLLLNSICWRLIFENYKNYYFVDGLLSLNPSAKFINHYPRADDNKIVRSLLNQYIWKKRVELELARSELDKHKGVFYIFCEIESDQIRRLNKKISQLTRDLDWLADYNHPI